MAIFFPLFTLLEDFGYLPRVAFVLDHAFHKARACGKQSLTLCMGFGCNAAGVTGCRIIDSPRERLIAIITNSFVPCNGRFPTLIALITIFFAGTAGGSGGSILAALLLLGVLVLGVLMTFVVSRLLSATLLRGVPSAFALELPPYRMPRIRQVLVRSVLDRTLFVLARAAAVAAPAGLVIWLLANVTAGGVSLLAHCTAFLDPFARLLGLDGVILMAFILGMPANEIVLPLILMAYLSTGTLIPADNLESLRAVLVQNGWTGLTAVCTILFTLLHWPCSTTCLTAAKETRSVKWTVVCFLAPTLAGMLVCFLVASGARLLGMG
ncbi:Fe(2+) transporter FeoB [bioreactor metagenome]|uniref:Fe(2+) transporter FeoB n=1 Tax=bioreactor metagenome TaxID=1076179 RepID=A0A645DG36_9ZZZZ